MDNNYLYLVALVDNDSRLVDGVIGVFGEIESAEFEAKNVFADKKYLYTEGIDVDLINFPNACQRYDFGTFSTVILMFQRYHDTERFYAF